VWRQMRRRSEPGPGGRAIPPPLRALLALQALVMGVIGAVMFIEPSTADDLWPWALTPLTARAVSAFLIGFAAAAAYAVAENRAERFAGAAYSYATLGALELLVAAVFSADFDGGARTAAYVAFVAGVLVAGVAGSLTVRRAQRG